MAARSATAVLAAVLAVTTVGLTGTAAAQPTPPPDVPLAAGVPVADAEGFTGKVADRVRDAQGPTSVFIELAERPAVDVFAAARRQGRTEVAAANAAQDAADATDETSTGVVDDLASAGGAPEEIFRTSNAVPGIAVTADAARIREIADSADVRRIYPLTPKTVTNSNAAVLTNTLKTWQDTGLLGDDMRVGIIDTGIDYTHSDFGGPGTVEAFDAVDETTVEGSGYPTAKVVGGYDFVGNGYDASGDDGSPVPVPDPNPIDCNDHGSHVSGTAAGFGVNADGSTFTGDYRALTPEALAKMKIGPGMAPNALLYALKVFGCEGSTNVTAEALDWALDPDGDKNFSDHLDVINLSLGSSFGAPDDPENAFVQKLSDNGVLSVFSAGNSSDVNDAAGTPGNSPSALTVASSRDSYVLRDGAEVTAPADLAGVKAGQYSGSYSFEDSGDLPATPVVNLTQEDNLDGCTAFSAEDAARVAGKVVWLEWDDDGATRRCGSATRTTNASDAGAVGSVFTSTVNQFSAGLAGNDVIPVFQFTADDTDALRPAVADGTLEVSMRAELRNSAPSFFPEISDTLSSFSSRGGRGPAVKPDVTAPGDTIASALSGSGDDVLVISGTSMASPHTAGIATLVRQQHPDWTVEEVKAAVMNTARTKVSATDNGAGPFYGPQRVGSGRVDARAATSTQVLAFVKDDPGFVSTNFGVVEVGADTATLSKTVKVVNKGTAAQTMTVGYDPRTAQPGVAYTVAAAGGGDTIRLSPKGTAEVTVTMTATPAALRKVLDPTSEAIQAGVPRQYVGDASGNLVLTATGGTQGPLLVPVYSAAKPVADIAGPENLEFGTGTQAVLNLTGRGVNQGTGTTAYRSLVSTMQLTGSSPQLPVCTAEVTTNCTINKTAAGADIRYVGAASTAPLAVASGRPEDAALGFGFATWGPIANLGSNTVPFVDFDVTGDGEPDFETFVAKPADTDVLLARTVDLNSDEDDNTVDLQPLNGQFGDVDTNVFDTSVFVLPVTHAALGVDPALKSAPITFSAGIFSAYTAPGSNSSTLDAVADMSFDATAPAFTFQGGGDPAFTFLANPATAVVVNRNASIATAQEASQLLLLHHHNAVGEQAQLVEVTASGTPPTTPPAPPVPSAASFFLAAAAGGPATATGRLRGPR